MPISLLLRYPDLNNLAFATDFLDNVTYEPHRLKLTQELQVVWGPAQ